MSELEDWVHKYTQQGWVAVPIRAGTKQPYTDGWQNTTLATVDVPDEGNVGLLTGLPSGGLIDVDLDWPSAREVASDFLPPTLMSGRVGSPKSHMWYECSDGWSAYVKFVDRLEEQTGDARKATILEVRGTGRQTLVEPSIHPSGNPYEWTNWGTNPKVLTEQQLLRLASITAAVCLLGRYWPREGNRHDTSLALAGMLCRYELLRETPGLLFMIVGAVAHLGHDDEVDARVVNARTTLDRWVDGKQTTGIPRLKQAYGNNMLAVSDAVDWLDRALGEPEDEDKVDNETLISYIDLSAILRDGVPETDWLVPAFLQRNRLTVLAADGGTGKTFVALWAARQVIREGGTVYYWDEENDPEDIANRCIALGMTEDEVSSIRYASRPGLSVKEGSHMESVRTDAAPYDLVIIDSLWDLMTVADLDQSIALDMGLAMKQVEAFLLSGSTVLLLDHTGKTRGKGDLAGSPIKKASAHVAYTMVTPKGREWDEKTSGFNNLYTIKARGGNLQRERHFDVEVDPGVSVEFTLRNGESP